MTFFGRAASFVAILSFAASLVCSTPGYAIGIDRLPLVPATAGAVDTEAAQTVEGSETDPLVPALPLSTADYASLAAAVAAQDLPGAIEGELACLAGAVFYESHGEPLAGQLAVAEVVLNRSTSGRFAHSVCGVVTQPGQFSFVRGGQVPSVGLDRAGYRTAVAVAQVALARSWSSPAPQALFFHARRVSPSWSKTQVAAIGNHVFYR